MGKDTVLNIKNPEACDLLTELIRSGAQRLIAEAIEIEVESFIEAISARLWPFRQLLRADISMG